MTMATRPAILFPLILLVMLALLTFWINTVVQPVAPKLDGSGRHDPDYIMSNFVTTQTDINGALRYKLAATEMKHFPDDDSTDLLRPRYTQFTADKPYTQVEGLHGHMSSNGKKIELTDQVKITRQAFADKGEMTVETDFLTILPDDEIVSTDRPVLIRQAPNTVIHATGMLYEKKNNMVTLLHKVSVHYERPKIRLATRKANISQSQSADTSKISANESPVSEMQSNPQKPTISNARIRRRYEQ